MVRLEMLKLSRMWDHKPGVAKWWERIKARPSYEAAITKWLRPDDFARYEKLSDPWIDVSKNIAAKLERRRRSSWRTFKNFDSGFRFHTAKKQTENVICLLSIF